MKVTLRHTDKTHRICLDGFVLVETKDAAAVCLVRDLCEAMEDEQLLDFFKQRCAEAAKEARKILIENSCKNN
jgi:hypothetical protein